MQNTKKDDTFNDPKHLSIHDLRSFQEMTFLSSSLSSYSPIYLHAPFQYWFLIRWKYYLSINIIFRNQISSRRAYRLLLASSKWQCKTYQPVYTPKFVFWKEVYYSFAGRTRCWKAPDRLRPSGHWWNGWSWCLRCSVHCWCSKSVVRPIRGYNCNCRQKD